jgi:hypothetical protein
MAGFIVLILLVLGLFAGIALIVAGIVMRKRIDKAVTVVLIVAGSLILLPCIAILIATVLVVMVNLRAAG